MKKNKQNLAGFTLIELLVTIVIVGILSALSIATYNNYISDAKESSRLAWQASACKK